MLHRAGSQGTPSRSSSTDSVGAPVTARHPSTGKSPRRGLSARAFGGTARCAVVAAALAWSIPAQTVVTGDVNSAIAAANPGDVLLIEQATQQPGTLLTLDKGVTLVGPFEFCGGGSIAIPAGQHARLVDVRFSGALPPASCPGAMVDVSGSVVFERCSVSAAGDVSRLTVTSGNVIVDHCTIRGRPALDVLGNANVTVVASTIRGADLLPGFGAAGFGIRSMTGVVHVSHSVVVGGDGFSAGFPANSGNSGIYAGNAMVFLTDSTVRAGDSPPAFFAPPALTGQSFQIARTSLHAGAGATPVVPFQLVATDVRDLLGATDSASAPPGASYRARVTGPPNTPILLFLGSGADAVQSVPSVFAQPFWTSGALQLVASSSTNAAGVYSLSFTVPPIPTLEYVPFSFHAVGGSSLPLQVAPVLGGVLH